MSYLSHVTWQHGWMLIMMFGLLLLAAIAGTIISDVLRGRPLPSQEEVEEAIRQVSGD